MPNTADRDAETRPNDSNDEIEVTDEMAELGCDIILGTQGVAEISVSFSGRDLAEKVYVAMERLRRSSRDRADRRNPVA